MIVYQNCRYPNNCERCFEEIQIRKQEGDGSHLQYVKGYEETLTTVKINKKDLIMAVDEELSDLSVEEIAEGEVSQHKIQTFAHDRTPRKLPSIRCAFS